MAGTKLLPCPFCGGKAHIWNSGYFYSGKCYKCGCTLSGNGYVTEAEAIEAWNTRADFHGYEQSVIEAWSSIKAYQERTCYDRNASAREHGAHLFMWRCSNCDESYDTEMDKLNYCPNCGARVTPKNSETTPKVVSE